MDRFTAIGIALLALWIVAWAVFRPTGGAVHLLLVAGTMLIARGVIRRATAHHPGATAIFRTDLPDEI
jgi:hypothetical protein